jgi:hypothetical protein
LSEKEGRVVAVMSGGRSKQFAGQKFGSGVEA